MVTAQECEQAKAQAEKLSKDPAQRTLMRWHQRVVDRFEQQQAGKAEPYRDGIARGPPGRRGDCDQ